MDSFELNKIAGTLLGAVFVVMTLGLVSDALFHVETPEQQGFAIVAAEGSGDAAEPAEEEVLAAISPLLASADAAAGESVFRKCATCHTIDSGGQNKVGPNLWEIVNRPAAAHEGFSYSSAMRDYAAADGGKIWDFEALNRFLHKPKSYISGTSMGFAGLNKEEDRANLIVYLHNQAASPAPLP